jgi:hypothetical protein
MWKPGKGKPPHSAPAWVMKFTRMHALLDAFPEGRYVLLLDSFEDMIDPDTREIKDTDLK